MSEYIIYKRFGDAVLYFVSKLGWSENIEDAMVFDPYKVALGLQAMGVRSEVVRHFGATGFIDLPECGVYDSPALAMKDLCDVAAWDSYAKLDIALDFIARKGITAEFREYAMKRLAREIIATEGIPKT